VTSRLDDDELVRLACQAFGVVTPAGRPRDKAAALGALELFLQDEARAGRRCLLIVDEAQNLTIQALEELRMLSNFQLGAHPLLQILLLGQPEFRDLLTERGLEQLRQRVIATHHLDAMEPDEVGPYIEHRLAHVGWKGRPAFGPGVYARLAQASGGVPRRINQLANRLLLLGEVEQADRFDGDMVDEVIADLAGDAAQTPSAPTGPVDFIHPQGAAAGASPAPAADEAAIMADLARELAKRDEQIAELQQAVMELADMRKGAAPDTPEPDLEPLLLAIVELTRRVETLETRTGDQNEAIRHVLTMLIEWLEAENAQVRAA
jgi:hypothetical protein